MQLPIELTGWQDEWKTSERTFDKTSRNHVNLMGELKDCTDWKRNCLLPQSCSDAYIQKRSLHPPQQLLETKLAFQYEPKRQTDKFQHPNGHPPQSLDSESSQAQLTLTRPFSLDASFSKAEIVTSKSSGSQPVHRSTTFKSTLLISPRSSSKRCARRKSPHNGFALELPPVELELPAASKR